MGSKALTREQAVELYESEFWKTMEPRDIAEFQLFESRLCMPFRVFQEAIEAALGRPVYTHEFGMNPEGLKKELLGEREKPSLEDILKLLPKDKAMIVVA